MIGRRLLPLLALGCLLAPPAVAQFPDRPVRLVVPFTPGGSPDVVARLLGTRLSALWGQPVVVENRAGAGGNIGVQGVVRAAPDGHVLLVTSNANLTANPAMGPAGFDPLKDLTPLAVAARLQMVLAVPASSPARSVAELVELAARRGEGLAYGSSGNGSVQHLATELLRARTGMRLTHVPYRGAGPALQDLVGGRIDLFIGVANSILPLAEAGQLRVLGGVAAARYPNLPDLPAIAETVQGYEMGAWLAVAMPPGAAPALAARISADVRQALSDPALAAQLLPQGIQVTAESAEAMRAEMEREVPGWARLVASLDPAR